MAAKLSLRLPADNPRIEFSFAGRGSADTLSPMAGDAQLTPMMTQYRRIKAGLPADALLLFRLGDF